LGGREGSAIPALRAGPRLTTTTYLCRRTKVSEYQRKLQWELSVRVFHDNRGWRIIEMASFTHRGWSPPTRVGRWRGIGVPGDVVRLAGALAKTAVEEHLWTRYGQLELFELNPPGQE